LSEVDPTNSHLVRPVAVSPRMSIVSLLNTWTFAPRVPVEHAVGRECLEQQSSERRFPMPVPFCFWMTYARQFPGDHESPTRTV
jgi:hypothetical protein